MQTIKNKIFTLLTLLSLLILGGFTTEVWGRTGTGKWSVTVSVYEGEGTASASVWRYNVAVADDNVKSASSTSATTKTASHTEKTSLSNWALDSYYPCYTESPSDGYAFEGWYNTSNSRVSTDPTYYPASTGYWAELPHGASDNDWSYTYKVKFIPVTVDSENSNTNPTTNPLKFTEPGNKNATVVFNVSNADATADFNAPSISGSGWTLESWSYANNKVTVVVKFTATASTPQGANDGTVTLTSKGTSANQSKSATVSANVNLTPTISVSPESWDFGMFTVGVDAAMTKTFTLTKNVNAVSITKTADASINPFSATISGTTLTVTYNPTSVGTGAYSATLRVTATNGQTPALSAYQDITLNGQAQAITDPEYTCNISDSYMVDDPTLDLQELWMSTSDGAITYTIEDFTPSGSNNGGTTAPAITSNRYLSLGQAGTVELKLTQTGATYYYAGSDTKTITISKYTTSFSGSAYNMMVDGTQTANYSYTNTSAARPTNNPANDFYYTIDEISYTNQSKNKKYNSLDSLVRFTPTTKQITALNAGTGKITFRQKETYKYTGDTVSFNVTVSKYTPSFTWNGGNTPYYHNTTINNIFSSTGNSPYTIAQSTDTLIAREDNNTLSILTKSGTAQFTVTQEENYYWNGKQQTYNVTTSFQNNHVPFTITSDNYFNPFRQSSSQGTLSWDDGIKLGSGLEGFNWDDRYYDICFTGIPDKLSFTYEATGGLAPSTGIEWWVKESTDGVTWTASEWGTKTENSGTAKNIQLKPATRYLRFCFSGNLAGWFKNITVTELKQFEPTLSSLNFGENQRNVACASQTLGLTYANAGHSVTLTTDDDHFSVTPAKITTIGGEQLGTYTPITVSYRTDELHSASDAKLIIRDELGHETFVTLIGSTLKKVQNITWNSPYNVDEPIIPVGKSVVGAASAGSGLAVTYTTSDESVIEIVNGTSFRAVGVGSATITAHQAGDPEWEAAEDSPKTFHVTAKKVQMIVWGQDLTGLLTTDDPFALTARVMLMDTITGEFAYNADRTNLLDYNVENTAVATVSGSTLTIQGEGSTTITASVPGDEEYEAASVTMPVEVSLPSATCEDRNLTLFDPVSGGNYGYQEGSDYILYKLDLGEPELYVTYEIDQTSGVPGVVSFKLKGTRWGANYRGNIEVRISDDGNSWSNALLSVQPTVGRYTSHTIELQRTTRFIRFIRPRWGEGYHHIGSVKVLPAQYLEAEDVDFGPMEVGSSLTREIDVYYSNVKGDIAITSSAPAIVMVDHSVLSADCGAFGSQKLKITCSPSVVADIDETITISEPLSGLTRTIHVTAEVTRGSQIITWNPERTTFQVVESAELTAVLPTKTNKGQTVTLESSDPTVVDIIAGQAVIYKPGNVTITASQAGNANFAPAENVEKDFVITLANLSLTAPSASSINDEQPLSASILTGGTATDVHGSVDGTWSWESPETVYAVGTYYPRVIFTPNEHPEWYTGNTTTTTIVVTPSSYRYDGNGRWDETGNWNKGNVPTINDDVVINGNVTIPGEANAKSLTINEGSNVTLSVSGQLTIGSGNSKVLDNYGNLHVENGGKVILNEGELNVKDFILDAQLSGRDVNKVKTDGNSGQVKNPSKIVTNGKAYFDLTFDPSGKISFGWYDFTVPFSVNIQGGIARVNSAHNKVMESRKDFIIMEFDEADYANGGKGWRRKYNGVLQPGILYSVTFDDEVNQNTFRFTWNGEGSLANGNAYSAQYTQGDSVSMRGWNGLGNGMLRQGYISGAYIKAQVFNHTENKYEVLSGNFAFAVGTAFFIQVDQVETVNWNVYSEDAKDGRVMYAPKRAAQEVEEFHLSIREENSDESADGLYVSANEDATDEYVIGRDLMKMGTPTEAKSAQMWVRKRSANLCDIEMPLVYGEANCDLNVFAPADGTYLLEIENGPADAELYLTFNGKVIWDLTSSPASLVLKKGLKEGFGLRMKYNDAPGMAEGVDDINDETQSMRKVLIDNKIYIITPEGAMYDVNGKLIR